MSVCSNPPSSVGVGGVQVQNSIGQNSIGQISFADQPQFEFRLLEKSELPRILPLLKFLNPTFSEELMLSRLAEMADQGYECVAVFREGQIVACSGIWIFTKVYCGRFIEPDNVCVDPSYRSHGLGARMIEWICRYGEARGCDVSELNAYTSNHAGHKFWLNQGYKILGFHFQKELRRP